jgi:probable HAF family extracellular repeat protein
MRMFRRAYHLGLFCLLLIPQASAQSYTVTDLGTLPGGSFSSAQGINASGHVTGTANSANGDTHPFLWTQNAGMVDIAVTAVPSGESLQGFWINSTDQIVGSPGGGVAQQAFFYNGNFSYLSGGLPSSAKGINDSGQIAGHIAGALPLFHAAIWPSPTSAPVDIATTVATACGTSPSGDSDASFVNNAGLVAGHTSKHAFLYNILTAQVTCIPTPGPLSIAGAVNANGQVTVGYFDAGPSFQKTLIWTPTRAPITIPTLNNFTRVIGGVINDSGQVVGTLCTVCAGVDDLDRTAILQICGYPGRPECAAEGGGGEVFRQQETSCTISSLRHIYAGKPSLN